MKSSRKIKKTLETDGDLFMRKKKQEILSEEFLDSAKSQLPQKSKRTFIPLRFASAVAMVAVLVICSVVFVPLALRDDNTQKIDYPSKEPTSGTTPPYQNDLVFDPSLWEGVVDTPYAVVKINEISNETIRLSQNGVLQNYVKIKGEVIFSYSTERFENVYSSLDDTDVTDLKVVAFNSIREFYITEQSSSLLTNFDTIFISVVKMNMDGQFYYGPATNDQGISEYLPVVNDKLQINEEDYNTRSFVPIKILNDTIDELREYIERGGTETDFTKALPCKKITSETTVEEINLYFEAWGYAKTLNAANRNNNPSVPS